MSNADTPTINPTPQVDSTVVAVSALVRCEARVQDDTAGHFLCLTLDGWPADREANLPNMERQRRRSTWPGHPSFQTRARRGVLD